MNGRYYRGPCPGGIRGTTRWGKEIGGNGASGHGGGYSGGGNDILLSQTGGGGA